MTGRKVKVLIVDDSAVVRQTLEQLLASDPDIEVIGSAADPFIAAERMKDIVPDVITLDVEMPRMDGLTFLKKIMTQHPIPVVMCSSLTDMGSETALKALEYGAIEIITKPKMGTRLFLEESRVNLCDTIKAAANARIRPLATSRLSEAQPKLTADVIMEKPKSQAMIQTTEKILVVGASTGGTEALREFLEAMPADAPGIVIVQHMPEKFTEAFVASSLLFCVGSMAILGAIEEGMGEFPRLFVTKSLMDGMASAAMAASMGPGIVFSALPVLLYQGGMTFLAGTVQTVMTPAVIDEVSAVGGLLLLGIGLSILEIKRVKAVNMLPALLLAGILASFFR